MKIRLLILALIMGTIAFSCKNEYPGYKKSKSGLYYKYIVEEGDTARPVQGDVIKVALNFYDQNDSLLYQAQQSGGSITIIVEPMFDGDIYEGFMMMGVGDSMSFYVRADSLVESNLLTRDVSQEGHIRFEVKMLELTRQADWLHMQELEKQRIEAELEEYREVEPQDIQSFLDANKGFKGPKGEGYYVNYTKRGMGRRLKEGMIMVADFECKLINDVMVASSSVSGSPLEYKIGSKNFFIKWDEAIADLRKGSEVTYLFPSAMAFGREGGGNGLVPPYAPLLFELKIKDVLTEEEIAARKEIETAEFRAEEKALRDAYLQKNGITTEPLPSGLIYIPIEEGAGKQPGFGSKVRVHYTGRNLSGEVFDSSVERGEPFEFTIGMKQVIAGWDEGIALMKAGGKAQLIIPSELAYGDGAQGALIRPYSTLVFDVELLEVE